MNKYFAFSSGGAYHFQGGGEWKVRADDDGHLSVEHDIFGAVTRFGPFQLSEDESAALWDLIAGAAFEQRTSPPGPGMPEESLLGFALSAQESLLNVQLWTSEALQDDPILKLLDEISALIEKYTGKKPELH
jgi:hypothetical protein